MDPLKQFIENNAQSFCETLPEGHEARFLQKMEKSRKPVRWTYYIAIAASVVLIAGFSLYFFNETAAPDPCEGQTAECYKDNMGVLASEIYARAQHLPATQREDIEFSLNQLLNTDYGVESSLPAELPAIEREAKLKEYYSGLYNGLRQIAAVCEKLNN